MKSKAFLCALVFGALVCGGADSGGREEARAGWEQPGKEKLARLAKDRVRATEKAYRKCYETGGEYSTDKLYRVSTLWLNAQLDAAPKKKADRVAAFNGHLQRMRDWAKLIERLGNPEIPIYAVGDAVIAEAEYWLERERLTEQ